MAQGWSQTKPVASIITVVTYCQERALLAAIDTNLPHPVVERSLSGLVTHQTHRVDNHCRAAPANSRRWLRVGVAA